MVKPRAGYPHLPVMWNMYSASSSEEIGSREVDILLFLCMSVLALRLEEENVNWAGRGNCKLGSSFLVWEQGDREMDNEEVVIQAERLWLAHQGVKWNSQ